MNVVQQLKTKGFVTRGQFGVEVQTVSDDMVKAYHLKDGNGAAVVAVTPGSGADKAGIQAGDIIVGFDGHKVDQASDLPPLVGITKPGTKVPMEILRDGKKMTVEVTVGEAPRDKNAVDNLHGSSATAMAGSQAPRLDGQADGQRHAQADGPEEWPGRGDRQHHRRSGGSSRLADW